MYVYYLKINISGYSLLHCIRILHFSLALEKSVEQGQRYVMPEQTHTGFFSKDVQPDTFALENASSDMWICLKLLEF